MATRRRGVKYVLHSRRRRRAKTNRRRQIYRSKSVSKSVSKSRRRINKVTRKIGRLYHIGGAKGDAAAPVETDEIEDFIQSTGLVPEGRSSQDVVENIIQDVIKERREQGLSVFTRPTKLSLFGKLFEYLFIRTDLGLDDQRYTEFLTKTKNSEKYDVHADFTRHGGVPDIYKNCFLSLKTKKMSSSSANPFAGYVETGKASVLLESLQDVVDQKIKSNGFKMVVESYYPVEQNRKVVAIVGMHRRVYDIKGQIQTILGKYNSPNKIQELLSMVERFTSQGNRILDDARMSLPKRCDELNALKDEISGFSAGMTRDGCCVRLDVKASDDCKTFVHTDGAGKKSKKPQYRVASSLNIGALLYDSEDPGSPMLTKSPTAGSKLYEKWGSETKSRPASRSGRTRQSIEDLLQDLFNSRSTSARGASPNPQPEIPESKRPRSRSRSRSTTPVKEKNPKSSGRGIEARITSMGERKSNAERFEEEKKQREIEREKQKKAREERILIREQLSEMSRYQQPSSTAGPAFVSRAGPAYAPIPPSLAYSTNPFDTAGLYPDPESYTYPPVTYGSRFPTSPVFGDDE